MVLNENVDRKIIPIAGGKGGVGKSVLAVNLALCTAIAGKKTVLVDLDLGGSNIHTLLGLKNVNPGIGNLVSGHKASVAELVVATPWDNLFYVPGDVLVYGLGEINKTAKSRITKELLDIDADYIFIDLGGGSNFTVVDFFLISNSGLLVTTPQSTSVMNAYSFLKNYVYRFLQRAFAADKTISAYLKKILKEQQPGSGFTVADTVAEIRKISSDAGDKAETFLEVLQPKLILNKVKGLGDIAMGEGLRDLSLRNLSINLECLGTVMNNPLVDESVDKQVPFVLEDPENVISEEIFRISQKIVQSSQYPYMPLELDYYSDTFELAHIETENDLAALDGSSGNPDSEQYDVDKLLELIRIQQTRIPELQGTLRMLSSP